MDKKKIAPGTRVTAPGRSPSAPREVATFIRVETIERPRAGTGYFAVCRRDDGTTFTCSLGLIMVVAS